MKLGKRLLTLVRVVGLTMVLALVLVPTAAAAGNDNPRVLPPQSHAFGKTYGEWSAAWWQWVLAIPTPTNPFTDDSGVNCGIRQAGPVFYLVGTFTTTVEGGVTVAKADRGECTVPAGKALFFPIYNNECSNLEAPPFYANTLPDFVQCNKTFVDTVTDLHAEIDGVAVQNLQNYRARSPIFNFFLPTDNIFGIAGGGTGRSMADGYYLLLAPLRPGQHSIHFHGFGPAANFVVDVTYAPLTVK